MRWRRRKSPVRITVGPTGDGSEPLRAIHLAFDAGGSSLVIAALAAAGPGQRVTLVWSNAELSGLARDLRPLLEIEEAPSPDAL